MPTKQYDCDAHTAVDGNTGNIALLISDGLDGTMSIFDKNYTLLKQFNCGFSEGFLMIPKEALDHYREGTLGL